MLMVKGKVAVSSIGQSGTSPLGRTIRIAPQKPMPTAVQRRQPTFSPRKYGAMAVSTMGDRKVIAVRSASGTCFNAMINK